MEAGIAFPMVLAILFAYYRTENIKKKRILIGASILLGMAAAVISAVLRSIPNLINRTSFSFWSMLPVSISLIGILMMIAWNKEEKGWEGRKENLFCLLVGIYSVGSFFYYMPAVLLQLDSFVYYGESAVSTMVLFRVIGYSLAILLMILSAVAVYATGVKLSPKQLKLIVLCSLFIRGITQLMVILQRLYSIKLIPRSPALFAVIAGVINNTGYFDFAIMAFLLIAPLIVWKQNIRIDREYRNRAELRKIKYGMKTSRHLAQFFILLVIINIVSLSALKSYAGREVPLSKPEEYLVEEGHIVVPLSDLEDGHLHRYAYTASDGKQMRFIIIKKAQGSYGVGLDACELCGPSGYFERNDEVVCKLCDVVMNKGTIGFKGGCNPIPFPYIVHDKKIKIDLKDLDDLSYVFR